MEFAKQEMQAVVYAAHEGSEGGLLELNDLELATVGGGTGAVSLG